MRQTYLPILMAVMLSGPASAQDEEPFAQEKKELIERIKKQLRDAGLPDAGITAAEIRAEHCRDELEREGTISYRLDFLRAEAFKALNVEKPREALELVKLIDELDRLRDLNLIRLSGIYGHCDETDQQ